MFITDDTDASHGPLARENVPHLLPGHLQNLELAHACLQALALAGHLLAEGLPLLPLCLPLLLEVGAAGVDDLRDVVLLVLPRLLRIVVKD